MCVREKDFAKKKGWRKFGDAHEVGGRRITEEWEARECILFLVYWSRARCPWDFRDSLFQALCQIFYKYFSSPPNNSEEGTLLCPFYWWGTKPTVSNLPKILEPSSGSEIRSSVSKTPMNTSQLRGNWIPGTCVSSSVGWGPAAREGCVWNVHIW